MARGEFVENSIWSDPDFDALSLEAGMLYLWSFTNPRCNMAGLYKVSARAMLESKVPQRKLAATLRELAEAGMLLVEDGYLWVRARVKYLHSNHRNFAKAVANDLARLDPDHPLRVLFLERYADHSWLRETLRDLALETRKVEGLGRPSKGLARVSGVGAVVGGSSNAAVSSNASSSSDDREDVEQLCSLLAQLIEQNGRPTHLIGWPSDNWREAARLLLDRDHRLLQEAVRLIRWSQADDFWKGNVLSMSTFRKQYDRLRLKAGVTVSAPTIDDAELDREALARAEA